MNEELAERIGKAARVLQSLGATEVYAFGSATRGDLSENSDIDLAVRGLPAESFFRAMGEASDILGRPLDLIDLDDGGPFVEHLQRNGALNRVA